VCVFDQPINRRPRPTTYRPPPRMGTMGAAGVGVAGGAAVGAGAGAVAANAAGGNKPVSPCQIMKDGVAMYNFGAPGCDP
jgi:hypothetical protein